MTDNEIIKALEWLKETMGVCSSDDEYTYGHIILELINRQNAEIKKLNTVNADMHESLRLACETNKDLQAEIERLKEVLETNIVFCGSRANGKSSRILGLVETRIAMIQEGAIKEFAERLKEKLSFYDEETVDNLVKEMVGDTE